MLRKSDCRSRGSGPLRGDSSSNDFGESWSVVYDELRAVARRQLRSGRDTLQATALVHEAYLRLGDDARVLDRGRAYFFAAAARAMRQILVDHARARARAKRGGGATPVTLKTGDAGAEDVGVDVLDLHRALEELETLSPRQARVVECRYFGGLDVVETAEALDTSPRTVKRDWRLARTWLFRQLGATDHG
ncbi:MAG: ECF-type sigma factor [Acidobacteriota bacterium]